MRLTTGTNNPSLVLAFELPESRRVLLFPADAQAGKPSRFVPSKVIDRHATTGRAA